MTYGVDQCRVCGKDIPFVGPKGQRKQEEANKKPILPEKEWRRRGYLASPTHAQLHGAPAEGCCNHCGLRELNRRFKYSQRVIFFVIFVIVVTAFVVRVMTYLPH